MPPPVIVVSHLAKSYGSTVAVADVSMEIDQGEIFGLIGPNGAGKTTTMECVEAHRRPDRGEITVLGNLHAAEDREVDVAAANHREARG